MSLDSKGNNAPSLGQDAISLLSRPSMQRHDASASPPVDDATHPLSPRDPPSSAARLEKVPESAESVFAGNVMTSTANSTRLSSGGIRRIASIREDTTDQTNRPKLSPTLAASFDSPLQTTSTESTESVKTVKGDAETPLASALRTPSYPFPYVPGTPQIWNSSFHKPFTTLSPTISSGAVLGPDTPQDTRSSAPNTPIPSTAAFMPPSFAPSETSQENSLPAPNLYDLVLMLNLEPGMTSWWSTITQMFQEFYGAGRISLALPADAGEVENVPWGQKATFNYSGIPAPNISWKRQADSGASHVQHGPAFRSVPGEAKQAESHSSRAHNLRPHLHARHSYAGFERDGAHLNLGQTPGTGGPLRPTTLRTKSHAQYASALSEYGADLALSPGFGTTPENLFSMSDTEFSTDNAEGHAGPYSQVLQNLRALDYESNALLEASSVNKIIERGKLVVLTRHFSHEGSGHKSAKHENKTGEKWQPLKPSGPTKPFLRGEYPIISRSTAYEEYEQMPCSPWSQSPAPSPAIQTDQKDNPFFSTTNVDEESFKPPEKSLDYTHSGAVEAIGIDKASTVIHIPLIHPRYLSNFPFRVRGSAKLGSHDCASGKRANEGRSSPLKRAPIAILSFSASEVPYSRDLIQSLQLLSPHLSTTFEMAQQYTSMQYQLNHRQSRGQSPTDRKDTLSDLADADIDISNDSTSMTSPSDYSGRSRQSPGGSVGTPGWDHGISGFTSHGIAGGTPSQMSAVEMVDSYFDTRNRVIQSPIHSSNTQSQSRVAESPARETEINIRKVYSEERSPIARRTGPKPQTSEANSKNFHSVLHSYGADFNSTFHTLPAATAPIGQGLSRLPDAGGITPSMNQTDMPPPSERLLRTIVDSLPVQIFTASPGSGVISWVNSKFIVYRGQEASQVINDPWRAIHPEDRPGYLNEWQRSLNTGQQFSHKVRLQRFDGAYRWFYVRATSLRDKRQKIVHWAGTYMDIHEQHVAEVHAARQQETAASEAKYRALANSSPQIVFAITRSRGIVFCNSQWLTYSGQTEEQAMGIGFMDFVHPEDLAKCRLPKFNSDGTVEVDAPKSVPSSSRSSTPRNNTVSENSSESGITVTSPGVDSVQTGHIPEAKFYKLAGTSTVKLSRDQDGRPSYSTELRLRSKEGEYRWHLVRVLLSDPIRSDETEEETWYGTCTDINDHKILEQTLKDTMDAKSRFLSNMSHEIRTPLNGILGMVNFLIDTSLSNEQMEHVNIIRNSTEGLRDLINDILDLSKVEAGMITLNVEWMHVRSLIEEVNDIMFALAVDKGLELNYLVESNVPSMVKGDRLRIRQVLLNIVGNAIKFTQKGEVFVICNVENSLNGDLADNEILLQFQVIDTGRGFNEKEAEFLFKRFSQIDSSGSKTGNGTGLGLAISMQLVELHGGSMRAASQPGKGATFMFTVKCSIPSAQDGPSITASSSAESIQPFTASIMASPQELTENSQGIRSTQVTPQDQMEFSIGFTPSPKFRQPSSTSSSVGSNPSLRTVESSIRSQRSSVSSAEVASVATRSPSIPLELPRHVRDHGLPSSPVTESKLASDQSVQTVIPENARPGISSNATTHAESPSPTSAFQLPNLFSILVICPLKHTCEAIVKHIELTLPKMAPSHITARNSVADCSDLLKVPSNPVRFSHIVIDLPAVSEIISLLDHIFSTPALTNTCAVIVTDVKQRREITAACPQLDFELLTSSRRVLFLFKPLKPSKIAVVFDPQKKSEVSTDQNQNSAQAVAMTQKVIFQDLKNRLGDRQLRVLLIEDNKTSQMVISRFLGRVGVDVEVAVDGAEGTKKVFDMGERAQKGEGKLWDLVLCDLYMPIKDGYQACKEIRRWERATHRPHMPIIALSANVLGDVYAKCVEAGFNSYVTKPVDFTELRDVLIKFLDPPGGLGMTKLEFMKLK